MRTQEYWKVDMAASSKGKVSEREFDAGPWKISVRKSHILKSVCELGSDQGCGDKEEACHVCK